MAIAFTGSASAAGLGISIVIPKTVGLQNGDWMVAFLVLDSQQVAIEVTGYTTVGVGYDAGGGGQTSVLLKRYVADATAEPAGLTASWNITCNAAVTVASYSGCDTLDCFNAVAYTQDTGASHTAPSTVTSVNNCQVLRCFGNVNSAVIPSPASGSVRVSVASNDGGGMGYGACASLISDAAQGGAAPTGTVTATVAGGAIGNEFTFAIQPPATGGDGAVPPAPVPDQDGLGLSTWPTERKLMARYSDANVNCLPVSTTPLWTYARQGSSAQAISFSPIVSPDTTIWMLEGVGVGDSGTFLHAIYPDGTRRLIRTLGGWHGAAGLTVDQHGRLYFQESDLFGTNGVVYCYNRDGSVRWIWTYPTTPNAPQSECLLFDSAGNIYTSFVRQAPLPFVSRIVSLTNEGIERWRYIGTTNFGAGYGGICYDAGTNCLYFVQRSSVGDYTLTQMNTSGTITATLLLNTYFDLGDFPPGGGTPTVRAGRLYVALDTLLGGADANYFFAVDVAAGSLVPAWIFRGVRNGFVAPIDSSGNTYLSTYDGATWRLTSLDSAGATRWSVPITGTQPNVVIGADALLVWNTAALTLDWYSRDDGSLLESASVPTAVDGGPPIIATQRVYLPADDQLIAFETVSGGGGGGVVPFPTQIEFLPETFLTLAVVSSIVDVPLAFTPETFLNTSFGSIINFNIDFLPETFLTILGLGAQPVIRPVKLDITKPTAVFWYHEHRLYASIGGKTYCRDLLSGTDGGWTDCGYGYVNSRFIIHRFSLPYTAFLAAKMDALGYGDRTTWVSLTHRRMTPEHLHTDVVPYKQIHFRPFGSDPHASRKLAERLRVWGKTRSRDGNRRIGTLSWQGERGIRGSAALLRGLYDEELLADQRFPSDFVMWLLECDLDLNDEVVDAEVLQALLEWKAQD